MRIKVTETKVYKFNELSEEAQDKTLSDLANFETDREWWDTTLDCDANDIGLKIDTFDIDRGNSIKGSFLASAEETAHKIKETHGDVCDTYKTATQYLKDRDEAVDTCPRDENGDMDEYECDKRLDELDTEFLRAILEDYLVILRHEYENITSREYLLDLIEANEWEFTENGHIA